MKSSLRRVAIGVAAVLLTATIGPLVAVGGGTAYAAGNPPWEPVANPPEVGHLLFFNAAGEQITGGSINTSPLAAYVQGTTAIRSGDTVATLFGVTPVFGVAAGQWGGEQLSGTTSYPNATAPTALASSSLPLVTGTALDESLATYVEDFPNTDTSTTDGYAGMYVLRLFTSASGLPATTSYDSADIQLTGTNWSVVYPAPTAIGTTTSVSATPSSPQGSGTNVTITATVSPAAPGTVQFQVGTTDIGAPVTVDNTGKASIETTTLPIGTDTLNAVYTPGQFADYVGSSGNTPYKITAPTTTNVTTNPTSTTYGDSVQYSATVTSGASGTPSGSVTFNVGTLISFLPIQG